jgi:hypothetical protein
LPVRVHVAHGAIHRRGLLQHLHELRGLEVAGTARLHARVARLCEHERQPADLQLGAVAHHEVGAARPGDQARARLDAVRVLAGRRGDSHLHARAAELLHERSPLRRAGEYHERDQRVHG